MKLLPLLLMGIIVLNSCEGELDNLGSQLVEGADGFDKAYSLIAYNVNNEDVQKVVTSQYDSVRIGAFTEPVFGGQKVSYITQLRLNTYNPDFGKNPVIDSVVLTLKPRYETATDSIKTTTNEDYVYPDGQVAAKKVVTTYPVRKYGKYKIGNNVTPLTIKVHEVLDFLGSPSDSIDTNKTFTLNTEKVLGSKSFNGTVNSVVITKDSDASEILKRDVSFRMKLDSAFFQNKIIAKQGNQVLKDAASFIRYFRGLSISVEENDGYLFSMAPNDAGITIYYKNDVTATDGTVTRTKQETALSLGSSNVHLSQVVYDRAGTNYFNAVNPAVKYSELKKNPGMNVNPAEKIYMQGMGGSSIGIRIPQGTIDLLKQKFQNEKVAIVSAKIRLYNDIESWDNKYKKPSNLLVQEMIKDTVRFLPDMTALSSAGYSLVRTANLSTKNAYYDIGVTATLKDIVEKNKNAHDLVINVGSYLSDASTGTLLGQDYNDRPYNPFRIVLKGTDINKIGQEITNSEFVQLRILYTKK
ncbi:DUF4270 domain-containing protein [Epilithonimonas arachidiradicis]|uniref:Uncharacterized protein DUF4270 n=2 Tax=Epilithonimonas arachidiradicis TaxID=1617282 RepID=A0A420D9A8_9FLAO|nr:DUF4270 domain-containing protein [Epilithonimonas arachidiradicis]RKE87605.1 uncharacterized protein DUF4270 [Epilithonimonas arachidiradicis]